MASGSVLDFDQLLKPIPGDCPTGIARGGAYQQIHETREKVRRLERDAIFGSDEVERVAVDWGPVLELGQQAIAEESKDLDIAAWLLEALVRRHGYAGLRDGFRLVRLLVEQYWDHLHPMPDEDGISTRVARLTSLNGSSSDGVLIDPIRGVPITDGRRVQPLTVGDYKQASELDRVVDPEKKAARISQGALTMEAFVEEVRSTPREFYVTLLDDLNQCIDEYRQLCATLETVCGKDETGYPLAPPSSNIRNVLEECLDVLKRVTQPLALQSALAGAAAPPADDAQPARVGAGASSHEAAVSREAALLAVRQAAEYFKRTEPHSPISYLLEQAVRWGHMPLPDLLTELIGDNTNREQLFRLIGIRGAAHEGSGES